MSDSSIDEDALDAGLEALYGGAPREGDSVLHAIEVLSGAAPHVLLREVPGEDAPLVDPSSGEGGDAGPRYQIVGELARGGMGVILKGRDVELGRDVAMKVLKRDGASNAELIRRFVEEAQIGGQLQHPGIVPVYELGLRADRRPFFTMKLVKGKTLSALLADRADPRQHRRRFLSIFEQVCQTMAYAHARGVVHRDLKPANVMVGTFGEVQIVDWGFAKVLAHGGAADEKRAAEARSEASVIETVRSGSAGSQSVAGSVMGTPAYMPPEQARGHIEELDERSDVFALGAMLCEILTGQPPYTEGDDGLIAQAANARLDDAYRRLERWGGEGDLVRIARDCLAPARRARPRNAGAIAERLSAHLASVDERARRAELQAARERHTRRLTVTIATALLICLGLGATAYLVIEQEQRDRLDLANLTVSRAIEETTLRRGEARSADLEDLSKWSVALAEAERTAQLALESGADDATRTRAALLRATVHREERAARQRASRAKAVRLALAQLRELGAQWGEDFDPAQRDERYEAVFSQLGLDAERLRTAAARDELVAALDAWILLRRRIGRSHEHLLQVAKGADPDPWRNRLRNAASKGGLDEFETLAGGDLGGLPEPSLRLLGDSLGEAGNASGAVAAYGAARELDPTRHEPNFGLAMWLTQLDAPRWAEAARLLTIALAARTDSLGTRYQLGLVSNENKDLDGAIAAWREVHRRDPGYGRVARHLAEALDRKAKLYLRRAPASAVEALSEAVRLMPEDADYRAELAFALRKNGNLEAAASEFREAIRYRPGFVMPYVQLGSMKVKEEDYDGAIRILREGQEHGVDEPRGVRDNIDLVLAWAYLGKGDLAEAASVSRAWGARKPPAGPGQLILSLAMQLGHDERLALRGFRLAYELDPSTPATGYHLVMLLCFCKEPRLRDYEEALRVAEAIIDRAPEDPLSMQALEAARYRTGDFEGARKSLERALEIGRGGPRERCTALLLLSMTYRKMGRTEDARRRYDDANRLLRATRGRGTFLEVLEAECRALLGLPDSE